MRLVDGERLFAGGTELCEFALSAFQPCAETFLVADKKDALILLYCLADGGRERLGEQWIIAKPNAVLEVDDFAKWFFW